MPSAARAGPSRPRPACPLHPQTSYWLGDANEMVAINTILIIVNGGPAAAPPRSGIPRPPPLGRNFPGKRRRTWGFWPKRSVNHSRDWLWSRGERNRPAPGRWKAHGASDRTDQLDAIAAARA